MVGAIGALVSAVVSASGGGGLLASVFGTSFIGKLVGSLVVSLALSFVSSALSPKPDKGGNNFPTQARNHTTQFQSPTATRTIIYGNVATSGPVLYAASSDDNAFLHIVIGLASCELTAIDTVYFNNEIVTIDGSNKVTAPDPFGVGQAAYIYKHLGAAGQTVDAHLLEKMPDEITSNDTFSGIAYLYGQFGWDASVWTKGSPPNIMAKVRGKALYDPRTTLTAYSNNPALCIRDYLTNTEYGVGAATAEIDDASIITAANICDESVNLSAGGTEARYTCNGVLDTVNLPSENLSRLLTSCAGKLVYTSGVWKLYAGAYRTPSLTLTEDDLKGPIQVSTRLSRRDTFNGVKGLYISEDNKWQPADFPTVSVAAYVTEDANERIWGDITLPYTTSAATAQRIAKLYLESIRRQIQVSMLCKLTAYELEVGDTVRITNTRFGWSAKVFEVMEWEFIVDKDGGLGVSLVLKEHDSGIYTWTAEDTATVAAPTTNLPDPWTVTASSNITAISDSTTLIVEEDGTITPRIYVTWYPSTDALVLSGGQTTVQFKKTTDVVWSVNEIVGGAQTHSYIYNVIPGVSYQVRVSFQNTVGATSAWTTSSTLTAVGKEAPPQNVSWLIVNQNVDKIMFTWPQVTDVDLNGYEIRYGPRNNINWSDGFPIVKAAKSALTATTTVPPGSWTFLIKAIDTSGNYSQLATATSYTVVNENNILQTIVETGYASGTLTNLVQAPVSGDLVLDTLDADSDDDTALDECIPNPVITGYYTSPEIDLGFDDTVRVWSDIRSTLCPGVTSGVNSPRFQISYRLDSQPALTSLVDTNAVNESGTFVNCHLHWTGVVKPDSTTKVSDYSAFSDITSFTMSPWPTCSYEAPTLDLGADALFNISARPELQKIWSKTDDLDNSTYYLNYSPAAGPYTGYAEWYQGQIVARYLKQKVVLTNTTTQKCLVDLGTNIDTFSDWTVGDVTGRYIAARVRMDSATGLSAISDIEWYVDLPFKSQSARGVAVGGAGTNITFDEQYHSIPKLKATMSDGTLARALSISAVTTTGFHVDVFNTTTGGATTGTIDWEATGY